MRTRKLYTAPHTWQEIVACVWVAFVSSAALKLAVPYVHWFFTLAVLVLLCPRIFGSRNSGPVKFIMGWGSLLVLAIVMIAPITTQLVYNLEEAAKLGIVFLVVTPLLLARADISRGLRLGAEFAVAANGVLVLAGLLGVSGVFALTAAGRYGTFLNGAGSLWRVGILVLVSSALNLLMGRSFIWPLTMFISSVALLVFDGSRTAGIAIITACGFIGYFIVKEIERNRFASRRLLVRTAVLGLVLLAGIVWRPFQGAHVENVGFADRLTNIFDEAETNGITGVESTDEIRTEMLRTVIDAIVEHPLVGTGMQSTAVASPDGPVDIHNSYLQAWADIGFLGFIAYTVLTVGILFGPWVRRATIAGADTGDRISFINGIFVLTCWAISGVFHPVSTEISEWVMVIVGVSGLQAANSSSRPRQAAFQFAGSIGGQTERLPAGSRL